MDLAYILAAAAIIILPFVLTRFFSGGRKEGKLAGAQPSREDEARAQKAAELASLAVTMRKVAEKRANRVGAGGPAPEETDPVKVDATAPARDLGLMATIRQARETTEEVQQLVAKGRKVEAVKILRERSGLGLKEAKDLVDRLG
jgi:hypothetical protein